MLLVAGGEETVCESVSVRTSLSLTSADEAGIWTPKSKVVGFSLTGSIHSSPQSSYIKIKWFG